MSIDAIKTRIRERLSALGLSPNGASEAAGLDRDFVRTIMRGKSREPSADRMMKLAKVLNCRLEWLITGQGPVTEGDSELSVRDAAMLKLFHSLNAEQQKVFCQAASALAQSNFSRDDDQEIKAG